MLLRSLHQQLVSFETTHGLTNVVVVVVAVVAAYVVVVVVDDVVTDCGTVCFTMQPC